MKHAMIDLETLGTTADAVICSIGAVKFDLSSDAIDDNGFYASASINSNLETHRRIQEDTLMWWLKQPAEAQSVFYETKSSLRSCLEELSDWLGNSNFFVWSNGADFDLPMLAHAYSQHSMEVPWKFWNSRCFRTYKNLPQASQASFAPTGVKHNALTDAFNQAKHLQAIHAVVSGRTLPKVHKMVKT